MSWPRRADGAKERSAPSARILTFFALAALGLLAPIVGAHGADPPYDPLVLSLHAYLHADGSVSEGAPAAAGAVALPAAGPGAPGEPAAFAFAAPVAFSVVGGVEVELTLRAEQLTLARDAEGNALELRLEPDGAPVRVALAEPLLAPGATATARATLPPPARVLGEGGRVALTVRALAPGSLSVLVGGETPSRLDIRDMRVPSPRDLRLQDVPHTEFLLGVDRFEPPAAHAVNVLDVSHAGIEVKGEPRFAAEGTYVVLQGVEDAAAALTHRTVDRERRVEAAHAFTVNGVLARVHPGLGVVVRVHGEPVRLECVRHCPEGGFSLDFGSGDTREPPSALVPPPRDTSGIPVSEDAQEETRRAPAGALVAAWGMAGGAWAARKRRG